METPPVQYVTTRDGCSIAYSVAGTGETLVWLPQLFSNVETFWNRGFLQPWVHGLAERYRLVLFDGRNQGMSSRAITLDGIDDLVTDLEAMVDHLRLDRFILLATDWFCHVAVKYAARSPSRLKALVLSTATIKNTAWPMEIYESLAAHDWPAFLRSQVAIGQVPNITESVRVLADTITREDWLQLVHAAAASEIMNELPNMQVPSLVLHAREFFSVPPEESMRFAALMPMAQLVLINGAQGMGQAEEGLRAIDGFVAGLPLDAPPTEVDRHSGLSLRETEVLRLLAIGCSNQQIADELVISLNTVRRHVSNIFDKIGAANRAQAAVYAREHGLT